jgi:hypothetical protein
MRLWAPQCSSCRRLIAPSVLRPALGGGCRANRSEMRPRRSFLRASLFAFFGALGWFIWAVESETSRSCFSSSHYVPSAAIALSVVVALQVALEAVLQSSGVGSPVQRRSIDHLAGVDVPDRKRSCRTPDQSVAIAVGLLMSSSLLTSTAGCLKLGGRDPSELLLSRESVWDP